MIVYAQDAETLKDLIESAGSGDTVYLPAGLVLISETIHVPSGVTILGLADTAIRASADNIGVVFDLSNSTDVVIQDVTFELQGNLTAISGTNTVNAALERLTVTGDLNVDTAEGSPKAVVYFSESSGIQITNSMVANARAGFYVLDSADVLLAGNQLSNVNFGQFVVSGTNFSIENNLSFEAGVENESGSVSGQGDCVTVLGVDGLTIKNNVFDYGNCYLISFTLGINENIVIEGNVLSNGITHGIYVYPGVTANGITITDNYFDSNAGAGFASDGLTDGLSIVANKFSGDGILLGHNVSGLVISGNDGLANSILTVPSYADLVAGSALVPGSASLDGVDLTPATLEELAADAGPAGGASSIISHPSIFLEAGDEIALQDLVSSAEPVDWIQILDPDASGVSGSVWISGSRVDGNLTTVAGDSIDEVVIKTGSAEREDFFFRSFKDGVWSVWERVVFTVTANDPLASNQYQVKTPNDLIFEEADGGTDNVESRAPWFILPDHVENITLVDDAWAAVGNGLANLLVGNQVDNYLSAGDGDDRLEGLDGADILEGAAGRDQLYGGFGNDSLHGGEGRDELYGSAGDDNLVGDAGADLMAGEAGDDIYTVENAGDVVLEVAGEGFDRVFASSDFVLAAGAEVEAIIATASGVRLTGSDTDNLMVVGLGITDVVLMAAGGNDTLLGGAGKDSLSGGTGNDLLDAGAGDDNLNGGLGDDIMVGGLGNDVYTVDGSGDVVIELSGEGYDRIFASSDFVLAAGAEIEAWVATASGIHLTGGDTDNKMVVGAGIMDVRLSGQGGNDTLLGATGADRLSGGAGADILDGGAGRDELEGGEGNDNLNGGLGDDIMVGGLGDDVYTVDSEGDVVLEAAGEGFDRVFASSDFVLAENAAIEAVVATFSGIKLTGSEAGNLMVVGGGVMDVAMAGGGGSDTLLGGAGDDRLSGGAGNDILDGGAANDELQGGEGNDNLNGGLGDDIMVGGLGDDIYTVNSASDVVVEAAGEGYDRIFASSDFALAENAGIEAVVATAAGVRLTGNGGNDFMTAGTGVMDVSLFGAGGDDRLQGGAGQDRLSGGQGTDNLNGGAGSDWIEGGEGVDIMTGGLGPDEFVFGPEDFGGSTSALADRITDFSSLEGDTINLGFVDANPGTPSLEALKFVGATAFSRTAGELRYELIDGMTYIQGDIDGNGSADFMIRLDGVHVLSAADFTGIG